MKKDVKKFRNKKGYCLVHQVEMYSSNIVLYYGHPKNCLTTVKNTLSKKVKKSIKNEIIDYLTRYIGSIDDTSPYYCTELIINGEQWIFIHIGDNDSLTSTFQLGTIVHECLHAAIDIARSRGLKDDNNGYEALTYLTEYIFTNSLDFLKRNLYKRNKKHGKNNKIRSRKESGINQRSQ